MITMLLLLNNERNQLESWFSYSKSILEAFKIINILKII